MPGRLWTNPLVISGFPLQRASSVESISMSWCHHTFTTEHHCVTYTSLLIKSPWYTGGDFMFLYRSVRHCCRCTLTLNFQGQIWNLLYLSQKWCDCHEMKSKHIHWSQGLKCDHQVQPWPWHWPWIFKVKCDLDHLVTKVRCKDLPDSDRGHFRCWCAVDSSS